MRKFFKLFLLTAVAAFAMSVMTMAADHNEETISEATTLEANSMYHKCTINGSDSADAPLVITIPSAGITISGDRMNYDAANDFGLKIARGYVKIVGEDGAVMYHENKEGYSTDYIIKVEKDAALTLENVTLNGRKKDCDIDNPSTSERTWHGIYNDGTLNIEKGTVITGIVTLGTGYTHGCAVYNNGTLNMNGGEIKGNKHYARAGYSIVTHGDVNITNGLIYDNQGYSIYQVSGMLNMTGGMILGNVSGGYRTQGDFRFGQVNPDYADILKNATTLTDKDQNISIDLSSIGGTKDYFIANPLHEITLKSGGNDYRVIYGSNMWNIYEETHENQHQVFLAEDTVYLSLTSEETKSTTITAEVICSQNHTIKYWKTSSGGIVSLEPDGNKCKVTALNPGTVIITASTDDGVSDNCTVIVSEGNIINAGNVGSKPLVAGETYSDIILDGQSNGPLNLTIPAGGINVASTESGISCITVRGNVQLTGGTIYHKNEGDFSSLAIIYVEPGASLTINGTKIYGVSKDNISDGTDHSDISVAENVMYGIYIDESASANMQGYSVISRVHADHDIDEDGVIYNKGTFTIPNPSNASIHNNYACYAIYSDGGTQKLDSGAIVGLLPEDITIGGNVKTGKIYGIDPGTDITVSKNGFNEKIVKVQENESLSTLDTYDVTANVGGKTLKAIYGAGRWDFIEPVNSVVSFVKSTSDKNKSGIFASSHIKESGKAQEDTENMEDDHTIATSFFTTAVQSGKTNVICDIVIPAGTSYIRSTDGKPSKSGFTVSDSPVLSDEGGETYSAQNTADYKMQVAYSFENEGSQFGVIVNNLYSTNAKAYIRACTDDEYALALAEGYHEATVDGDAATVSLD